MPSAFEYMAVLQPGEMHTLLCVRISARGKRGTKTEILSLREELTQPRKSKSDSRKSTVEAWELREGGAICPGPDTEEYVSIG